MISRAAETGPCRGVRIDIAAMAACFSFTRDTVLSRDSIRRESSTPAGDPVAGAVALAAEQAGAPVLRGHLTFDGAA